MWSNAFSALWLWKPKAIHWQKQLFLLIVIREPEYSLIALLLQCMSKLLWLIYARTHSSVKHAQIFKLVLPNDSEVQRFAVRSYRNIVKMRLNLLNGSYRLDVRKLALSIGRNAWTHHAEIFFAINSSNFFLITQKAFTSHCYLAYYFFNSSSDI